MLVVDWRLRFLALALLWGTSFFFIKLAVAALAPVHVALGRILLGGAALLLVLRARGERLPRERATWLHLAVAALLLNALPFTLFGMAEQRISSALAGICNATTPLFTLLFALAVLPDERPTAARWLGLGVGFAGVVVVLGPWRGDVGGDAPGALLALAASGCYGLGWAYARRHLTGRGSSLALSAGQLIAAAAMLAPVAPLAGDLPAAPPASALLAVLALGMLGTAAAYVLSYGLLRDVGATTASTVTYFVPLVSIAIGVLVLGERLDWTAPTGAAVVLAGAWIGRSRARSSPTARVPGSSRRLFSERSAGGAHASPARAIRRAGRGGG